MVLHSTIQQSVPLAPINTYNEVPNRNALDN